MDTRWPASALHLDTSLEMRTVGNHHARSRYHPFKRPGLADAHQLDRRQLPGPRTEHHVEPDAHLEIVARAEFGRSRVPNRFQISGGMLRGYGAPSPPTARAATEAVERLEYPRLGPAALSHRQVLSIRGVPCVAMGAPGSDAGSAFNRSAKPGSPWCTSPLR